MNPVQIAPKGAIRSGFILFAIKAIKVHEQMGEQMTKVLIIKIMIIIVI